MMFDECPSWPVTHADAEAAMTRTVRWAAPRPPPLSRACERRGGRRRAIHAGPGAVRHHSRQHVPRSPGAQRCRARSTSGSRRMRSGACRSASPSSTMYEVVEHTAAMLPGEAAPVSDGDRHAGRPRRERGSRHRPLRLRPADAQRPQRAVVHAARTDFDQERAIRRGHGSAGSRVHVPDLPAAFPGLSAPHLPFGRDERARPSTRCTICTFTLTPCRRLGRLLSSEPSSRSGRHSSRRIPADDPSKIR